MTQSPAEESAKHRLLLPVRRLEPKVKRVRLLADGMPAGKIWPGREVGGQSGWVDITHALSALKLADDEYRMLVEEDFRGKCMLYR